MLGGLNKDEFIIAARPSMGKTAMALSLALNTALREEAKVAFFNLEMGKNQIFERALSTLGEIQCSNIKTGSLSEGEWERIIRVSSDLSRSNLFVYDKVFSLRGIKGESGSLEQDADVVMFLYRDEYYSRDTEDKDIIENIIAKNRNGQVGIVKLKWKPEYQKVE